MADHGLTGNFHIDGSQCLGKEDENGKVIYDCNWSAFSYMADLKKKMNVPAKKGFVDKSDPSFRPKGTTVLSCGCGIPWVPAHGRGKASIKTDVLICATHGITTITDFR